MLSTLSCNTGILRIFRRTFQEHISNVDFGDLLATQVGYAK